MIYTFGNRNQSDANVEFFFFLANAGAFHKILSHTIALPTNHIAQGKQSDRLHAYKYR